MYIMITSVCNMNCAHCCNACSRNIKGQHMTMKTYRQALKLCAEREDTPFIGGGEPTLHPHFWEMLGLAIVNPGYRIEEGGHVGLVTNGSRKKDALRLLDLAKQEMIWCELSQDEWHDPIDNEVVYAFEKAKMIRSVERILPLGHALKFNTYTEEPRPGQSCPCEDINIMPDGRIFGCGCRNSDYGTVDDPKIPIWHSSHTCFNKVIRELEAEQVDEARSLMIKTDHVHPEAVAELLQEQAA